MIRYALACDEGHAFESWFANSATYDRQVKRGLVSCPVCNSTKVEKAIMAPRVAGTKRRGDASVSAPVPEGPASSQPSASKAPPETPQTNVPAPVAMMSPQEREFRSKLKELREHLIRNADYVGRRFPEEARKMHYGEIERHSVYGEATPDQAKELHEGNRVSPAARAAGRVELTGGLRALGLGQCITCAFSMLELPSRHPSARTARTRPRADGRVPG